MEKTITIQALCDKEEGTYMRRENGAFAFIVDANYNDIAPKDIVGTTEDPRVFDCNHIAAANHILSDKEVLARLLEDKYSQEEWDALSAEEKDGAIEDYLAYAEMDYAEYGERHIEWRTLTFTLDGDKVVGAGAE